MNDSDRVTDLRFGCPFCGASGGERCISDYDSEYMDVIHGERLRFAAVHDRSVSA